MLKKGKLQGFILFFFCFTSNNFNWTSFRSATAYGRNSSQSITKPRALQGGGSLADEIFKSCVDKCNERDIFYSDEYIVYLTTQATSFIIKKGQNGGNMNVQPLERIMLNKNNSFVNNYWMQLPNYEVLPKPLYKIFVKFACLYPAGTTTDTAPIISFCGDPNYPYTEPPFDLAVSFILMKPLEKGEAIQRICQRSVGFWDELVLKVEQYYRSEGLILDIVNQKKNETKVENKNFTSTLQEKPKRNETSTAVTNVTIVKLEKKEITQKNVTTVHIINATIVDTSTSHQKKGHSDNRNNTNTTSDKTIKVKSNVTSLEDVTNSTTATVNVTTKEKKESNHGQKKNVTTMFTDKGIENRKNHTHKADKNTTQSTVHDSVKNFTKANNDKKKSNVKNETQTDKNSTVKDLSINTNTTYIPSESQLEDNIIVSSIESDQNNEENNSQNQKLEMNGITWGIFIGLCIVLFVSVVSLLILFIANHWKKKSSFHGKAVKILTIPGVVSAASDSSLSVQEKIEMVCQTFDEEIDQGCNRFTFPKDYEWDSTQPAMTADQGTESRGFVVLKSLATERKRLESKSRPRDPDSFWNVEALSWERYAVSDRHH
jgi:hypothetical protein